MRPGHEFQVTGLFDRDEAQHAPGFLGRVQSCHSLQRGIEPTYVVNSQHGQECAAGHSNPELDEIGDQHAPQTGNDRITHYDHKQQQKNLELIDAADGEIDAVHFFQRGKVRELACGLLGRTGRQFRSALGQVQSREVGARLQGFQVRSQCRENGIGWAGAMRRQNVVARQAAKDDIQLVHDLGALWRAVQAPVLVVGMQGVETAGAQGVAQACRQLVG